LYKFNVLYSSLPHLLLLEPVINTRWFKYDNHYEYRTAISMSL